MDALKAIHARRSIRRYGAEPVTDAQVEILLRAAMAAPSAGNAQPWEFVVVRRRDILEEVAAVHPYAKMSAHAPLAILACADLDREKYQGFWVQDVAAATQNLLLAATALGLGAVWCGVYPVEDRVAEFRRIFGLPARVLPLAWVVLGHPAEEKDVVDRYDAGRIHQDLW